MSLLKRLFVFSLMVTMGLTLSFPGLTLKVQAAGNYGAGSLLAKANTKDAAVYYIGSDSKKYVFPDTKTYSTWYADFKNVVKVSVSELDMYADGGAVTYRSGTKLVTNENSAKVYAVGAGGVLQWIPTAAVATSLYGANWGKMVQNVIPGYFSSSYTVGSDLSNKYPDGTVVSMSNNRYYIQDGKKRQFATSDAFDANNLKVANVIAVTDLSAYADGTSITGEEITISGFKPAAGGSAGPAGTLSVSLASDTPTSGIVVGGASRVPFTKVNLVNNGSSDVTVDSLTVERKGLAQDTSFSSLDLLDANMVPLNKSSKTLGAVHTATFGDDFVVKAGTTKTVNVAANMAAVAVLATTAGETPVLAVSAVVLKNGTVGGSFPISGNYQNINGTLTIGTLTVVDGGDLPATGLTKEVGVTNYVVNSIKLSAASEDVMVDSMVFTNNGSSDPTDVTNIKVYNANTNTVYCTLAKITEDSFICSGMGLSILKGKNATVDMSLDVMDGSAKTVSYDIDKQADITAKGGTYGFNILPTYTATSAEPYWATHSFTIGNGTMRVESLAITPSNVTSGASGVTLGKYKFTVKGEPMNVTSLNWNFVVSTSAENAGNYSDLTNLIVVNDTSGKTLAGPIDSVGQTSKHNLEWHATTTDSISFPVGETTVLLKGDLSSDFASGVTLQSGIMGDRTVMKGDVSGNTIVATPTGVTQSTTLTVRSATLAISVSATPAAQTIVTGQSDFVVANFILDGSTSGGTVRISSIKPKITTTGAAYPSLVSGWKLFVGSTQISVSSDTMSCSGATCSTAATTATTTLILPADALSIAPGASKTVTVKANIGTGATSGTFAIGLSSASGVTGIDSDAQTVTMTGTDSTGQALTLSTGGALNVSVSTDPVSALVVAGTTGNQVGKFSMQAKRDGISVNYVGLSIGAPADGGVVGNQNDLTSLELWEVGGSKLGEVAITGNRATITPTGMSLTVNAEKSYVLKASLPVLNSDSVATSGQSFRVSLTNLDTTGTSAGSTAVTVSGLGAFNTYTLFKSLPTVTQIAFSGDNMITANDTYTLKKWSVTANSLGPIAMYKFTLGVSTTIVSMDTTGYYLYVSSDASSLGTIVAQGSDFTVGYNTTSLSNYVEAYIDVGNDNAAAPAQEHQIIEAGQTKYYTFRGTILQKHDATVDNENISTVFAGDAAFPNTVVENATTTDARDQNDFIWSDLNFDSYTSSTATQTRGWYNGYRITGLDTTSSTAQVIND